MEIPDHIFHRQSWLSIIFGILTILGSFAIFALGAQLFWVGLMTLMFGAVFISLGARNVIKPQEYTTWIMAQIYNQSEKKEFTLDIDELKIQILKIMLDNQKKKETTDKKRLQLGVLGKNPYFPRCFDLLIESGLVEITRNDIYHIPTSKLSEVEDIIK